MVDAIALSMIEKKTETEGARESLDEEGDRISHTILRRSSSMSESLPPQEAARHDLCAMSHSVRNEDLGPGRSFHYSQ